MIRWKYSAQFEYLPEYSIDYTGFIFLLQHKIYYKISDELIYGFNRNKSRYKEHQNNGGQYKTNNSHVKCLLCEDISECWYLIVDCFNQLQLVVLVIRRFHPHDFYRFFNFFFSNFAVCEDVLTSSCFTWLLICLLKAWNISSTFKLFALNVTKL